VVEAAVRTSRVQSIVSSVMKNRGLITATVVFFILAGVLYWSEHHKLVEDTAKTSADTPPLILKVEESAITKLELKRKGVDPVVLGKVDSGKWQITTPRTLGADQSTVSGMVSTLSSLSSERLVEDKAADLKQYGLDQPPFEVDITGKDNKLQKLFFGDDTPTGEAVYALLAGDSRVFTVSKYLKNSVDKSLNDVRDRRLLTVNSDKIGRVELISKGKNQDIEFGRNKEQWQILKPGPLRADSEQVGELVGKLTDAKMDLSASGAGDRTTEFTRSTPIAVAKVTDESTTQELQVRKSQVGKDKDTYYATSSIVEGAYKVDSDFGKALEKGLDDFRNKKLFDFSYAEPDKIELHDGSKACFLTRNGGDWWSGDGKKVNAERAQSLIAKLRGLSAEKFLDSGFTRPAIEATVTSDDGKRTEKLLIAKTGNSYVARRQNETALYQISANSVDDLLKAAGEVEPALSSK
jgi:hypothetical protein